MWSRGVSGVVLCLVGVVWFFQGTNMLHGSGMSGNSLWTVLGIVLFALGVASIAWAWRIRRRIET